jgi:hypothetical protein
VSIFLSRSAAAELLMAEQLSLSDEHNNNDYYWYKKHKENALQILS